MAAKSVTLLLMQIRRTQLPGLTIFLVVIFSRHTQTFHAQNPTYSNCRLERMPLKVPLGVAMACRLCVVVPSNPVSPKDMLSIAIFRKFSLLQLMVVQEILHRI
jgi:hypothetical protein